MEKTGCNSAEMAALLDWSPSKVSRLLSGKRIASRVDIAALLALCGVVGRQRDEMLQLADDAYAPTWWQDYGSHLPIHLPTLANNEEITTAITIFHNTLVPDLLQTPAYTRALLRVLPYIPADEIDDRVTETLRRQQKVLEREYPPALRVFLDEHVLTRTGGGDAVMSDQAHLLLRMAVRPRIQLRVVPESVSFRDIKPFTLLEFADLPTVAYLEQPTSVAFLEGEQTIAAYQRVVTELDRHALNEVDSRVRLAAIGEDRSVRAPAG